MWTWDRSLLTSSDRTARPKVLITITKAGCGKYKKKIDVFSAQKFSQNRFRIRRRALSVALESGNFFSVRLSFNDPIVFEVSPRLSTRTYSSAQRPSSFLLPSHHGRKAATGKSKSQRTYAPVPLRDDEDTTDGVASKGVSFRVVFGASVTPGVVITHYLPASPLLRIYERGPVSPRCTVL